MIFDAAGRRIALREDVGRHNAVDKTLGRAFLDRTLPAANAILVVSGRASFELVQKVETLLRWTNAALGTVRPDVEFIYNENTVFNLGKFEVLTEGRDLLIVSAGYMVHECNKALDALDRAGIDASLVDLYSLPLDTERLLDIANENAGNVLVVEDNYGGGLGSAVAEACTEIGRAHV